MTGLKRQDTQAVLAALTIALVAFVTLYSRPYLSLEQPNALSRLYLTEAMAHDGRLDVLYAMKRHGIILDFAYKDRPFSDKAPGSSVLALPAYAAARLLVAANEIDRFWLLATARLVVLVPFSLWVSLGVLRRVLALVGVDRSIAWITAIGLAVGTIQLTYSQIYFGHVLAGGFLLVALRQLLEARARGPDAPAHAIETRAVVAGQAAGARGGTEYQANVCAAALLAFAFAAVGRRAAAAMAVGALPLALGLLAYNWRCFGSPFAISYEFIAFETLREKHQSGWIGFTWPRWDAIVGTIASRHRGLLFWSPMILLAPWGAAIAFKRDRALAVASFTIVAFYWLLVCSSAVWQAGWSLGPRLLLPSFPIAAVPCAFALERARSSPFVLPPILATVFFGMAVVPLSSAVLPGQAPELTTPLGDVHARLGACGVLPTNLGHHLGLAGSASLLPLVVAVTALGAIVIIHIAGRRKEAIYLGASAAALGVALATMAARERTPPDAQRAELFELVTEHHAREPHRIGLPTRTCHP